MPVTLASNLLTEARTRRAAVVGIVIAIAAMLAIATFWRTNLVSAVNSAASAGLNNLQTVAAMLSDRSPGQRPEGALASLKHKRQPVLHERALPKVRQPLSPLAAIVGAPPVPPVEVLPTPPLYSMVAGPPVALPQVSIVSGGSPPAPGSNVPPGGGIVVPPGTPTETPIVPVTPVTPAVPEPNSWAMMLLGFALVGWAVRRDRRRAAHAAAG